MGADCGRGQGAGEARRNGGASRETEGMSEGRAAEAEWLSYWRRTQRKPSIRLVRERIRAHFDVTLGVVI